MNFFTKLAAAVIGLCAAFSAPALAAPITYNFALTPLLGNVGAGSGSFTVEAPINGIFQSFGVGTGLDALNLDIDGKTFDLSKASNAGSEVDFLLGNLSSIVYVGTDNDILISLSAGALFYTYNNYHTGAYSVGNVTGAVAVQSTATAVPEPFTLALFGTGLAGVAVIRRRKKVVQA